MVGYSIKKIKPTVQYYSFQILNKIYILLINHYLRGTITIKQLNGLVTVETLEQWKVHLENHTHGNKRENIKRIQGKIKCQLTDLNPLFPFFFIH